MRLKFTDDALGAIAKAAIKRGTGARGLRAIVEEIMLNVMYDVPSRSDVREVVVTRETVERKADPVLTYEGARGKESA